MTSIETREHDRDPQIKILEISSCEDCNDKRQCGLAEKSPFEPIPDNCPLPSPCEFAARHAESVQDPGRNDFNTPIVEPPDYILAVGHGWLVRGREYLVHVIKDGVQHAIHHAESAKLTAEFDPEIWDEAARKAIGEFASARLATVSEIQEYLKKEEGR